MRLATTSPFSRARHRRSSAAVLIASAIVVLAVLADPKPIRAATTLDVAAGFGRGTVGAQAYGPGDMTVLVDDSVRFTIESDEVHTITFGEGPAGTPPDQWPVAGWTAPAGPPPWDLGSTDYDGTGFINTGIIVTGSTATVHFTAPGSFPFLCAIHPGMAGTVDVVEQGQATTQEEADQAAQATEDELLAQVDGLREARSDAVTSVDNGDGTKTWNVFADATTEPGPLPGGGTGYLELIEFIPDDVGVRPGDTVSWTANAVHTVTFVPEDTDPNTLDPFATPPSGDGTEYDPDRVANSGVFNAGPGAPASFSLIFPDEGRFPFLCLLHARLGQVGTVIVSEMPPADTIGPGPTASGMPPETVPRLGFLLAAAALGAVVWLVRRGRRRPMQTGR